MAFVPICPIELDVALEEGYCQPIRPLTSESRAHKKTLQTGRYPSSGKYFTHCWRARMDLLMSS